MAHEPLPIKVVKINVAKEMCHCTLTDYFEQVDAHWLELSYHGNCTIANSIRIGWRGVDNIACND